MLKKRLIFILFYKEGVFCLSRNFRLQEVGDVRWLIDKFNFSQIGNFIDELVILDVSRNRYKNNSDIFPQNDHSNYDKYNNKSLKVWLKILLSSFIKTNIIKI